MTTPRSDLTPAALQFSVGLASRFAGDDGTGGHLAASVHYGCRMAAQLDTTLDAGPLTQVQSRGTRALDAAITWGIGGECLLQATIRADRTPALTIAAPPHVDPLQTPSDAVWATAAEEAWSSTQVDAAIRNTHERTYAHWTVLLDQDLRALRLFGDLPVSDLAVASSRCQGVLHGLGLPQLSVLLLSYAERSLCIVPLQAQTLLLLLDPVTGEEFDTLVAELREALITPAPTLVVAEEPDEAGGAEETVEPQDDDSWEGDAFSTPAAFVPTGARFAGMLDQREPRRPLWSRRRA